MNVALQLFRFLKVVFLPAGSTTVKPGHCQNLINTFLCVLLGYVEAQLIRFKNKTSKCDCLTNTK